VPTPIQAPKANATAERFVGTARRECLDWTLIFGRRQPEHVPRVFVDHYNGQRPHRALNLAAPGPRATRASSRHDAGRSGGSKARPARRPDPRLQRRGLIWHREAPVHSLCGGLGRRAGRRLRTPCKGSRIARPPEPVSTQASRNGGEPGRGAISATTRAPPTEFAYPTPCMRSSPVSRTRSCRPRVACARRRADRSAGRICPRRPPAIDASIAHRDEEVGELRHGGGVDVLVEPAL
jgi:hypothetical protein